MFLCDAGISTRRSSGAPGGGGAVDDENPQQLLLAMDTVVVGELYNSKTMSFRDSVNAHVSFTAPQVPRGEGEIRGLKQW